MKINYPNILKLGTAIILGYAFGCCLAAFAQAPAPTQPPPTKPTYPAGGGQPKAQAPTKAPSISDALRAKFFKAQAEMVQAQAQSQAAASAAQQKGGAFQSVVKELQETCGKEFQPQMDASGDPTCIALPKPAAKPADAPKK